MAEPFAHDPASRAYRLANGAIAWVVYVMLVAPSLIVIPMSFGDKTEIMFPPSGFSLLLYREFFFASNWMATTWQSLQVAVGSMILAVVAGVPAAYALVRYDFPGRKLLGMFLLSPVLVPTVVVALGLYLYFSSIGLRGTTTSLIVAHTVHTAPFVIVTAMAGLRQIDANLEAAAMTMGASRLQAFWMITLPLLQPSIAAGSLFAFLISFDEVVISWFVSSVGTMTLPVKMYSSIQWEVSPVIAAVSTLLTVLSLFACLAAAMLRKSEKGD
ncbi:MAG: ABC transporter permease [Alphaproteobacteria bacterium]|nr:ABC transporter permease [Alphaproteobacteria bacterium]